MSVTIKNLTNSPFDLINDKGEKTRIAARGVIEGFTPHPNQAQLYRTIGYFHVVEADQVQPAEAPSLAEQYRQLTGEHPDGRWSEKRLRSEIEALL